MHRTKDQVRCPHCRGWVRYNVKEQEVTTRHLSLGHPVTYQQLTAYCSECQGVIPMVQEVDVENLRRLRKAII